MRWLPGKVALVVGGGSGIGRAVVEAFVQEDARVGVLELNPDKCRDLENLGNTVVPILGNATSPEDNRRAVAETVRAFGHLDTLVLCVGVFDYYTKLEDIPGDRLLSAFDEMFKTNVASYLISVQAALPELRKAEGSSIILTVSTSGYYPARGGVLYVASKFAVRGLVVRLAYELIPRIRVNGVAPGGTLGTDLRGLKSLGLDAKALGDTPGRAESMKARTPLQVALTAEDHAGAYVYLASNRSRGVTGEILHSDGGMGVR